MHREHRQKGRVVFRARGGQRLIKPGEGSPKSGLCLWELLGLSPTGWALPPSALISAGKLLLGAGGQGIRMEERKKTKKAPPVLLTYSVIAEPPT